VRLLTAEMPERPEYFFRDAEINRAGAPALGVSFPFSKRPPTPF
jgi:hypothetical protein